MSELKVINLYAGPGAGKSTTAAGIFFMMKTLGHKVELVTEYVKDKVYEGHFGCLEDQIYIFGKQQRKLKRLEGQVEYAVTDSPLMLSILYNKDLSETFNTLVLETYHKYQNINFYINRTKAYSNVGRTQSEQEAIELDRLLSNILINYNIQTKTVDGDIHAPKNIIGMVTNDIL